MPPLFKYPHVFIALLAFVLADIAVSLFARAAERYGAVDRPNSETYKTQKRAIPFVGGLGLFAGFIGAVLVSLDWTALTQHGIGAFMDRKDSQVALAILFGGSLIAVLGLVDDFRPINALVKLATLFAITLLLATMGLTTDVFAALPVLAFAVTLFWIVGVVSAFNAIDNTDGVAGTTGLVLASFLFLVAWGTSAQDAQPEQSRIAIALGGALLGFLRHNRPPARVYLGNCGAFTLGFLVAVLAISGHWTEHPVKSAVVPVMLLAYPIFDISYTVFMRWRSGIVRSLPEAVVISGRDHTAHRLAAMGLGPWGVIIVVGMVNLMGGLGAWGIVRLKESDLAFVAITVGVVAMYTVFGLVIRGAVDLRSEKARISHRRPTARVADQGGGRKPSGRFAPIAVPMAEPNTPPERNTRQLTSMGGSTTAGSDSRPTRKRSDNA